jgi:hypothetical protein
MLDSAARSVVKLGEKIEELVFIHHYDRSTQVHFF